MTDPPRFRLNDIIVDTEYFQAYHESILAVLQASFYCLDLIVKVLLCGPDGSGKRILAKHAANTLNLKFCEERVAELLDENIVGTEKKIRGCVNKLATSAPCLLYLSGYDLFCKLEKADMIQVESCIKESLDELIINKASSQPIILIAGTQNFNQVYHSPLSDIFQHHIFIRSPSTKQVEDLLKTIITEAELKVDLPLIMDQLVNNDNYLGNLLDAIARAEVDIHIAQQSTDKCEKPLKEKEKDKGTRWIDVGGLSEVKKEIIDTIQILIDYPQLKKSGLRRTGILLHGPPGTGKTLLAKAVATECNLNFINVKGPELLNEYVGQSEDNIRKLFQLAREKSPSVIFFDELDSLAPNRGQAGDSGGVMDRMVSQILSEMDGVGKGEDVFVIGATNRVDLVDPSLLRPGRFDKILEVPLPKSKKSRLQILRALTRKMQLSEELDLDKIESMAKPDMSGADFQGLCSRALQRTFDRCISLIESGELNEDDVEIIPTMQDFMLSLEEYQ